MPITPGGFGLALKSERVRMSITLTTSGNTNISGNATFQNQYNNPPTVIYAYCPQTIPYANDMIQPYINSVTTTGFSCTFIAADINNNQNYFGTGTLIAEFFVVGN